MEFFWKIIDKLFKVEEKFAKYEFKPECPHLFWTLPDKVKIGKEQSMKQMCDLELRPKPTCCGIFEKEPGCPRYGSASDKEVIV